MEGMVERANPSPGESLTHVLNSPGIILGFT